MKIIFSYKVQPIYHLFKKKSTVLLQKLDPIFKNDFS